MLRFDKVFRMARPDCGYETSMKPDRWARGYTQAELDEIQEKFGLVFPADLLALLRDRRPVGGHAWTDEVETRRILNWPFEGLLFDIEHNDLWWPDWGEKPVSPNARKEVLKSIFSRVPKLIPLVGHRYLPEEPHEPGNPIFSVYQADVIIYGADLIDFFEQEFFGWSYKPWPKQIKYIPFWSDLVERNS
jgi:hypothetical protein